MRPVHSPYVVLTDRSADRAIVERPASAIRTITAQTSARTEDAATGTKGTGQIWACGVLQAKRAAKQTLLFRVAICSARYMAGQKKRKTKTSAATEQCFGTKDGYRRFLVHSGPRVLPLRARRNQRPSTTGTALECRQWAGPGPEPGRKTTSTAVARGHHGGFIPRASIGLEEASDGFVSWFCVFLL